MRVILGLLLGAAFLGAMIFATLGESQVEWFEGNYQEYVADFKRRRGTEAERPHRIRFKKLER